MSVITTLNTDLYSDYLGYKNSPVLWYTGEPSTADESDLLVTPQTSRSYN